MPGMFGIGGHLGATLSALVDGQLDPSAEERAWDHVAVCPSCRRAVQHEGWTKRQLTLMSGGEPSPRLMDNLCSLDSSGSGSVEDSWAAVAELEGHGRGRRRAGIAAVGVGSVSAAVLGFSTLTGAPLGIGNAPSGPPPASMTGSPTAPAATPTAVPPSRRASGWLPAGPTSPTGTTLPVSLTPAP